jgi:fructan beta-fructosidase
MKSTPTNPKASILHVWSTILALGTLNLVSSCSQEAPKKDDKPDSVAPVGYYQEKHRPQFHFSPEEKWMNDPNGMVHGFRF